MISTKENLPRPPRKRGRPRQDTLKLDETRFTCRICNYELVDTIALDRHLQKHEPPGGFLCSVCKTPFTSPQDRNEHKSQAHPVYRCRPCKESFHDEAQFQEHHKSVHVQPTEGSDSTPCCSTCGTHFRTTFQLRVHLESKCGTKKHFQCDICQRFYSSQASLSVHRGLHQAKKSHLCDFCGASFYNRGQLKVHERVHTGDKPFKCDKCGKAFAHRESLLTHSTLHSGIKPYVCKLCNAQFSCQGNLTKHLRRRPETCGRKEHEIKPITPDGPSSTESMQSIETNLNAIDYNHSHLEDVAERKEPHPIVKRGKRVLISRAKVDDENDGQTEHFEVREVSGSESEDTEQLQGSRGEMLLEVQPLHDDISDTNVIQVENEVEPLEPSVALLAEECGKSSPDRGSDGEDSYLCVIVNNGNEATADDTEQHHWYTIVASETETRVEPCLPVMEEKLKNQQTTLVVPQATEEALDDPQPMDYERVELENESTVSSVDEWLWCEENVSTANGSSQKEAKNRTTKPKGNLKEEVLTKESTTENAKPVRQAVKRKPSKKVSRGELSQDEIDEMTIRLEKEELEEQFRTLKENYKLVSGADYQCNLCPVQHTSEYLIARHLQRIHGVQLTETVEMLHRLKNPSTQDKLYRCKYCGRMYSNSARLKVHVRHHGPEGKLLYKCTCCSSYFETAEESRQHALATHRDRLECSICQKQFQDPDCLQGHIRYAHRGAKEKRRSSFVCLRCGKRFTSRSVLTDHERSNCGDSPIYRCETCGKSYSSYGAWKVHKELHKDQLQFVCSYCMKRFRTKGQLKIHERSHTGEKPFRCEYCPKAFPYRESLMTHHAIHSGIKRFKCGDCSQAFTCASNLKSHRRVHHPS